ncbi:MAG: LysR family transcriptional regulator [Chloroflexota bacterium]|nr:LysR family transcriptional regulator [Chloroflexota bacterium]
MAIELRHLRYFVTVADEGQLTRAAARLGITQPALSRALRSLEQDLGVVLLTRQARGVELTPAGRAFYPKARQALLASMDAVDATRAAGRPGRELTLGFQPPWSAIASAVADAMRRGHPDTTILPRELQFGDVPLELSTRRVDAALVWPPHDELQLEYQTLLVEPVMVCMSAGHTLASYDVLRFADVESEPVPRLLPPQQPQAALWHLAARRSRPPRLTAEAPRSLEGVAALVACGRAVCFGSESVGQALLRPGLVVRPLSDIEPATLAIACLREGRPRRVDNFLAVARSVTEHDR